VPAHEPGQGATILVVEERRRDRAQLVSLLASQGYTVFEAHDARAALDLIDRQRPSLIISGAKIRLVGSPDLVRRLRAHPELSQTPVAFYAGDRDEPRARAAAARLGIREVLTSATPADAVLRTVRSLLAEREASAGPELPPGTAHQRLDVVALPASGRRQIAARAASLGDFLRVGEVAGVLVAAADALGAIVGADLTVMGLWDEHGVEPTTTISVDRTATNEARYGVDVRWLQGVRERASTRWSRTEGGESPLVAKGDAQPVHAVVAARLASAGQSWGWLVAGRRVEGSSFTPEEERWAALVARCVSETASRPRGADLLAAAKGPFSTRDQQAGDAHEVATVGAWSVDAALETFTSTVSLLALLDREDAASLHRCEAVLALVHIDDRERVTAAVRQAISEGGELDLDCRYPQSDGTDRLLHVIGQSVRDADGRVSGLTGLAADVTERRRVEAKLLQAQRTAAMGLLAASVAHDFNNVLTAILGQARLLADDLADTNHRRQMEQIHRAAERGTELTRQLLVFSRTQVGTTEIVGVNDVIDDVTTMLRRLLGAQIVLHTDLDVDTPAVRVERAQLEQVVLNLVVNARDAMPGGGRIEVCTRRSVFRGDERILDDRPAPGVYAAIAVADTGVGIDERVKAQIFEPFFTTKERGEGTGLGLTTVQTIVKRYGGYLDVRSAPGRGSVFDVYFPAVERRATIRAERTTDVAPIRPGGRVLVIEDELDVRQLVRTVLERAGFDVVEAACTQDAEAVIARLAGNIDLVIADVHIPGGTGPELFKRLVEVRPSIRAIFMSGYSGDVLVGTGGLQEGSMFLQKPFTIAGLLDSVRTVLGR